MYILKAITQYDDSILQKRIEKNEIIEVEEERAKVLLGNNTKQKPFCKIAAIKKHNKKGKKIILYYNHICNIGGIETFTYNFCKEFQDYNITIIVFNGDKDKIIELSEYANIILDDGYSEFECDVLILGNIYSNHILSRIKSKKTYQMIHACFDELSKFVRYDIVIPERIDKIITVSESARQGLLKVYGYDSKVIYNILDTDIKNNKPLKFITLSRATHEKGIHRIIALAKEFKSHKKNFLWFLCCSLEQATPEIQNEINSIEEIVVIKPNTRNKELINESDYLVQLSDTESFCYSLFEALQRNVPVITTNYAEAKNIVNDGENGYILEMDLSNLDVEKIFNDIPKNVTYKDRCDKELWKKILKGGDIDARN